MHLVFDIRKHSLGDSHDGQHYSDGSQQCLQGEIFGLFFNKIYTHILRLLVVVIVVVFVVVVLLVVVELGF